ACRDPEQVRAIAETGRNPRYLRTADLSRVDATTIDEAPVASADLVVVAVPSRAFAAVVEALPGSCPVLSLTKGLDPATGERLCRGHGRHHGNVLGWPGRQSARGPADRAGSGAGGGGGRDRPGGRGPDDGAGATRPLASPRCGAADHRRRMCRARGREP